MKNKTRSCEHGNQTPTFLHLLNKKQSSDTKTVLFVRIRQEKQEGGVFVFLSETG